MMSSLKDYADGEIKKGMVAYLLDSLFPNIPKNLHEEMSEVVMAKFAFINILRKFLSEKEADHIKHTAEENNVTEDAVIDSFVYFYLIAETSWLNYLLMGGKKDDTE